MGDTFIWNGGTGSFSDAGQWTDQTQPGRTGRAVPGAADVALLQSATPTTVTGAGTPGTLVANGTVTLLAAIDAADILTPGTVGIFVSTHVTARAGLTDSGALDVASAAVLTLGASAQGTPGLAVSAASGSASLTVNGSSSSVTTAGAAIGAGGTGALAIQAGGTFLATSENGGSFAAEFGAGSGDSGSLTVNGSGSTFQAASSTLLIGAGGTGTALASSGGTLLAGAIVLGEVAGASGQLGVDGLGSIIDLTGAAQVGAGGVGALDVTGAGAMILGAGADIGAAAGSSGAALVTGENSILSESGPLVVGDGGTGSLAVENAGTLTGSGAISIGQGSGGGAMLVTGIGSLLEIGTSGTAVGVGGAGTLDIVGDAQASLTGVLAIGAGGAVVLDGAGTVLQATAASGGSALGVGGTLTISRGAMLAASGLAAVGAGGLAAVSGSGSALQVTPPGSGAAVDLGGTLDVSGDGVLATTGTLALAAGGSLAIFGAGTATLGNLAGAGGSLLVDGGSTLAVAGSGTLAGAATISGGATMTTGPELDLFGAALSIVTGAGLEIGGTQTLAGQILQIDAGATMAGSGLVYSEVVGAITVGNAATIAHDALAITDDGMLTASGGLLTLDGDISGSGALAVAGGATLAPAGTVAAGMAVDFDGAAPHTLDLIDPIGFFGTVVGAGAGDSFVLGDSFAANGNGVVGATLVTGTDAATLLVAESDDGDPGNVTGTLSYTLVGPSGDPGMAGDYVTLAQGADGTSAVLTLTDTPPCFAAGTRIRTTRGEVPVEQLRIGDTVVLAAGGTRPVRWIGHRHVACAHHPHPDLVWPIRICADAFGPGLPARTLRLSPDHSVHRESVLIPVRCLLNGATVRRERVDSITYCHVELDRHDVLLAEGLPAESYLDTGNRGAFAHGAGVAVLHPSFARRHDSAGCAPLRETGPEVVAARAGLLARMRRLGYRRGTAASTSVNAAGRTIRPSLVRGEMLRFLLPRGSAAVQIVSASGIPAGDDPADGDLRALGVAIAGLTLQERTIPLDDPALGRGFHAIEQHAGVAFRWTDGAAALALPPNAGPRVLELRVIASRAGWLAPDDAALPVARRG